MLIPRRDASKNGTIIRSQARKNLTLVKEIEETSQGPLKAERKTQENNDKSSQYSETSNT